MSRITAINPKEATNGVKELIDAVQSCVGGARDGAQIF
jgi:hypothetical protein